MMIDGSGQHNRSCTPVYTPESNILKARMKILSGIYFGRHILSVLPSYCMCWSETSKATGTTAGQPLHTRAYATGGMSFLYSRNKLPVKRADQRLIILDPDPSRLSALSNPEHLLCHHL